MEEVAAAALVGAGIGYAVRFGQEHIQRAGRVLAGNEVVAGAARLGRGALAGGVQVAQAGARATADVGRAGARGAVDIAQVGARGGAGVAGAAFGRIASTARQRAGGKPPARSVRVPVTEDRPPRRRRATTAGQSRARTGTRAGGEPKPRSATRSRGGARARTGGRARRDGASPRA
jgi:hypothetical protein